MRSLAITLFLTLFVLTVYGQPVINRGDIFNIGDELRAVSSEDVPEAGSAGPNIIWDFSDLAVDTPSIIEVRYVDPATTEFGGDYPTSNLAQVAGVSGFEVFQYMNSSSDKIEVVGEIFPGFVQSQSFYSDPWTILEFPIQYQSTWDDEFAYELTFTSASITYTGEGTEQAFVDAYGTILLPQGTFNDVLRVQTTSFTSDSTSFGPDSERNDTYDTTYYWLSPSYPGPLAVHSHSRLIHTAYTTFGDTTLSDSETILSESFSFDPMAGGSSTHDVQPGKYDLSISPNPFVETLNIEFTADKTEEMLFVLNDIHGRTVYEQDVTALAGENFLTIQIPEIASGSYMALLRSSSGADIQKLLRISQLR